MCRARSRNDPSRPHYSWLGGWDLEYVGAGLPGRMRTPQEPWHVSSAFTSELRARVITDCLQDCWSSPANDWGWVHC